jgi:hypothetical protein
MAKSIKSTSRREHERFELVSDVYTDCDSKKANRGKVINISMGGLKVHYDQDKNTAWAWWLNRKRTVANLFSDFYDMSITVNGESSTLNKIPCKTVSELKRYNAIYHRAGKQRCLKFGKLRYEQIFHLKNIINSHTGDPVKDRRQSDDRRKPGSLKLAGGIERRQWWVERRAS